MEYLIWILMKEMIKVWKKCCDKIGFNYAQNKFRDLERSDSSFETGKKIYSTVKSGSKWDCFSFLSIFTSLPI